MRRGSGRTGERTGILGRIARTIRKNLHKHQPFQSSEDFWIKRYRYGGNSGSGSYDKLAAFKAEVINDFVAEHAIRSVIEYGCGDGNQLSLATYQEYTGFDVSPEAIRQCRQLFAGDASKSFHLMPDYADEQAELTLSLDVIYHLVEDRVYGEYMNRLFDSATRFVIIYSSNREQAADARAPHVRHREFTAWIAANRPDWALLQHIPNRYPFDPQDRYSSFADFYIYAKPGGS
ncbi:MAG: methyltransferase domain-containing protein [Halobacteria archaeon]|nr:methyltransferase domain-containing protein [Halobacteria archaeon]